MPPGVCSAHSRSTRCRRPLRYSIRSETSFRLQRSALPDHGFRRTESGVHPTETRCGNGTRPPRPASHRGAGVDPRRVGEGRTTENGETIGWSRERCERDGPRLIDTHRVPGRCRSVCNGFVSTRPRSTRCRLRAPSSRVSGPQSETGESVVRHRCDDELLPPLTRDGTTPGRHRAVLETTRPSTITGGVVPVRVGPEPRRTGGRTTTSRARPHPAPGSARRPYCGRAPGSAGGRT